MFLPTEIQLPRVIRSSLDQLAFIRLNKYVRCILAKRGFRLPHNLESAIGFLPARLPSAGFWRNLPDSAAENLIVYQVDPKTSKDRPHLMYLLLVGENLCFYYSIENYSNLSRKIIF